MTDPIHDPLAGSAWSTPSTVSGFAKGTPNDTLIRFARAELTRAGGHVALDLGCGAGRNAVPLAALGWHVLGIDLSLPMLIAAAERARHEQVESRFTVSLAPMHALPVASRSCDLLIAHGIWNLAKSGREFRAALREAGRVARPGAALFVFTFSRGTFDADAEPLTGETFVYTQFSGTPQCFLTSEQLVQELGAVGFTPDPEVPLRELNRRTPGMLASSGAPVIWEGTFRYSRPASPSTP